MPRKSEEHEGSIETAVARGHRRSVDNSQGNEIGDRIELSSSKNNTNGSGGGDDPGQKVNLILMKAAQRFFKESNGDEDKPVKDSIRVFNSFRIRSQSPVQRKVGLGQASSNGSGGIAIQQPPRVVPVHGGGGIVGLPNRQNHHHSSSNFQQKKAKKSSMNSPFAETPGISPKKRLARFRAIKDGANAQIGVEDEVASHPPSMNILEDINRFSASLVLQLEDSVIQEAIQNLGLKDESLRKWIEVSDFYSIHESVRMQMRRYLTALNEIFFQIEAIIKERDRLLAVQTKSALAAIADAAKKSPQKHLSEEKSIFHTLQGGTHEISIIGTLPNNNERSPPAGRQPVQPTQLQYQEQQQYHQQKLSASMNQQQLDNQLEKNSLNGIVSEQQVVPNGAGGNPDPLQVGIGNGTSKVTISAKSALGSNTDTAENIVGVAAVKVHAAILKCEKRSKAMKKDLSLKFAQFVDSEKRLTELRLQEAVAYEIGQKQFEVVDKQRKEFSERLKEQVLQEKLEKIASHNAMVEEKREAKQKLKRLDERRRMKVIKEMQQNQLEEMRIKEIEAEKRQLAIQEKLRREHQYADEDVIEEKPPEEPLRFRARDQQKEKAGAGTATQPSGDDSRKSKKSRKKSIKRIADAVTMTEQSNGNTNNNPTKTLPAEHKIICKYEGNRLYQKKWKEMREAEKTVQREERKEREEEFQQRRKEMKKAEKNYTETLAKDLYENTLNHEAVKAQRLRDLSIGIAKENELKTANAMRNLDQLKTAYYQAKDLQMHAFQLNKEQVNSEQNFIEAHMQRTMAFTIESQRSRAALLVSHKKILQEVERQEQAQQVSIPLAERSP